MKQQDQDEIRIGPTMQRVLVLLLGGIALGLTCSPKQYFRILRTMKKDWERINERALREAIRKLYRSQLIDAKDNVDGSTSMILTERGKKKALTYQLDEMKISPMKKWDRKWRIVVFDIPEKHKKARHAISHLLKTIGFYPLQKSVFVHPFECKNEVDFVVEFFNVRPFVRFILADRIDNELHLKKHFNFL